MKKILTMVLFLVVVLSASSYAWKRQFGLGIELGSPTGFTGKYWISNETAIDAAIAWNFWGVDLQADCLIHNFDLIKMESGKMPLYYGIGAYVGTGSIAAYGLSSGYFDAGVRVPLGIEYLLQDAPVEFFLEIDPSLNIVPGFGFGMGGSIGARYYFGNSK